MQLGVQAYWTSFVYVTDGRNPYVYAQPVPDIEDLQGRMGAVLRWLRRTTGDAAPALE